MEHQSQSYHETRRSYHADSTSIYSNLDSVLKKIVWTPQILLTQVNCVYNGTYEPNTKSTKTNKATMQNQLEEKKKV